MPVSKWETPNSPQYNGRNVIREYRTRKGDGIALTLEFNDGGSYADGYFYADSATVARDICYDIVRVEFRPVVTWSPRTGGSKATVYDIRSNSIDKQIETHPDFLCIWKFSLWQWVKNDETEPTTTPAWALESHLLSDVDDDKLFVWSVDKPAPKQRESYLPGDWIQLSYPLKPAVEAYRYNGWVITETKYYNSRNNAAANLEDLNKRKTPAYDYDITAEWLVTDCQITTQNGDYAVVTDYTAADAWDTDIYDEA